MKGVSEGKEGCPKTVSYPVKRLNVTFLLWSVVTSANDEDWVFMDILDFRCRLLE